MKPSIRKTDAGWEVTRPGYGFNPDPQVSVWPSWKDALGSLRSAPAFATAAVTTGDYTLALWSSNGLAARRPRRLLAEDDWGAR